MGSAFFSYIHDFFTEPDPHFCKLALWAKIRSLEVLNNTPPHWLFDLLIMSVCCNDCLLTKFLCHIFTRTFYHNFIFRFAPWYHTHTQRRRRDDCAELIHYKRYRTYLHTAGTYLTGSGT